uniref:Putative secreted protein n=1 Tax=Anopheles darlingi TaxID=43151 RepID=A0A2M4DKC3_ANODA
MRVSWRTRIAFSWSRVAATMSLQRPTWRCCDRSKICTTRNIRKQLHNAIATRPVSRSWTLPPGRCRSCRIS